MAGCGRPQRQQVTSDQQDTSIFDTAWARDALWDDGLAEVSLYDARRPQYGRQEEYQAVLSVVKEDFTARHHVKADPPYEGKQTYPVLKLNAAHSYWTGRYPYHFLLSVFVRRDQPVRLVKATLGSQEWCGNTFKELTTWAPQPSLVVHSYFDGEGDFTQPLDLRAGELVEDQFPLALRGLAARVGQSFERRVVPSLISNRGGAPAFVQARFEVGASRQAGTFSVAVRWPGMDQTYWFDEARPHALVRMEASDGRSLLLRERTRKAYWKEPTFQPEM